MTDSEKKVTYRAIADFSSLGRSVDNMVRKMQRLRKEQALLNAESAAAASSMDKSTAALDRNATSRGKHVKAIDDEIDSTGRHTAALGQEASAADRTAAAIGRGADATRRLRGENERVVSETTKVEENIRGVNNAMGRLETTTRRFANGIETASTRWTRYRGAAARAGVENTKLNASFNRTLQGAQRLKNGLDKLGNWRPRLTPPFIALVPLIAGVVAAINPLVAGLGAVSSAALGFGSSLGTLAGAAIGVIPALSTLLGVVGALKLAFGGIGGAFKAANKLNKGGGGGGKSAKDDQVELTKAEKIARAQEKLRRATQDVGFAEDDLVKAREAYIDQLKDLQKQLDKVAMSEARASANTRLAQENYANVLADPGSTKGQKMDAQVSVEEAKTEQRDIRNDAKDTQKELNDLKRKGINGDRDVIQAQRAVTDAIWAVRDAQIDLQNAYKDTNKAAAAGGGAADEFAAAMARLSPSARSVVKQLLAMRGEWEKMRRTVQESFFSKIVNDIQLLRRLFPPVTKLLSNLAGELGSLSSQLIKKVTSDSWIADIYKFADESVKPVHDIGEGLLSLLDAFKDLTIAALPFLTALAEGFREGAKNFAALVATAREDGSLAAYLERVRSKMAQWWRIIKNISSAIYNYGKAAGDLGDWLTDGFEKMTKGWADNAKNAAKAGSPFRQYLEDIKPLLKNINGLLGDFFGWIAKTAMNKKFINQMNDIVTIFRDKIGPAIGDILDVLADTGVSVALTDALASLAELIDTILKNGGAAAIKNFFKAVDAGFKALSDFASIPGVGGILTVLFQGLAGLAAISFVGKFTGLTSLLGLLLKVGRAGGVRNFMRSLAGLPARSVAGAAATTGATAAASGAASAAGSAAAGAGGAAVVGGAVGATGRRRAANSLGNVARDVGGIFRSGTGTRAARDGVTFLGTLGKFGKGAGRILAKGGAGGIAGIAGTVVGTVVSATAAKGKKGSNQRIGGNVLAGAATGAGIGATVGSAVPVIGTAIGAGVGGAIGGAAGFLTSSPEDKKKFLDDMGTFFGETVPNFLKSVGSTVWDGLVTFGEWLGEKWSDAKDWLGSLPQMLADAAGDLWKGVQGFGDWLDEKWSDAKEWLAGLPYEIGWAIGELWDGVKALGTWLAETWNDAVDWVKGLPQLLADTAGNIWDSFVTFNVWLGVKFAEAVKWLKGLPKRLADTAGNIWNNLKSFLAWLGVKFAEAAIWLRGLPKRIADTAGNIWNNLKSFVGWLGDKWVAAGVWLANLPSKVAKAAGDIWSGMKDVGEWIKDQGQKIADWAGRIGQNIKNVWDNLLGGFNDQQSGKPKGTSKGKSGKGKGSYNGGKILRRAVGGSVPGIRANSDTVPAMLTPGEFVIRKAIVNRIGADNLAKLNSGILSYAQMLQQAQQSTKMSKAMPGGGSVANNMPGFAVGGMVPNFGTGSSRSLPKALTSQQGAQSVQNIGTIIENLNITNPAPERASESLPKALRRATYLGGKK
jgi:hypothetical protein